MIALRLIEGLVVIGCGSLSAAFAALAGPFYFMIDDANEPGPPQNRRNAIIAAAVCGALALVAAHFALGS